MKGDDLCQVIETSVAGAAALIVLVWFLFF
jgi:hypothetical protein